MIEIKEVKDDKETIVIHIGTKTITDSNIFLRKLWGLLDKEVKNGWCYTPYTDPLTKTVYIGCNNVGSFMFDYKTKGCIDRLYISDCKLPREKIISIVEIAKTIDSEMDYYVECCFSCADTGIRLANQCFNNVLVKRKGNATVVGIHIKAFSDLDLDFWIRQKSAAIRFVLFSYTRRNMKMESALVSHFDSYDETEMHKYDYEWFDVDECPKNEADEYYLPIEFFRIISQICNDTFYDDFISAVVNASQMLYNAASLSELSYCGECSEIERTGLFDMINANIVSSLEALLSADQTSTDICRCCGQPIYKIVRRIYDLCEKYLGETMAGHIKKRIYANRSKYLHEGRPFTPLYRYISSFPLIDPRNPRELLSVETPLEYNLIDYCAYIIRKFVCDHYNIV